MYRRHEKGIAMALELKVLKGGYEDLKGTGRRELFDFIVSKDDLQSQDARKRVYEISARLSLRATLTCVDPVCKDRTVSLVPD